MNRNDLLNKLRIYAERWRDESDMIARFIAFVESHEDCFERSLAEGHVTGSAWVVNRAGTHVLLTHHKKLNRWLQLGGHADGDTDTLRVAMREVEEESGLTGIVPISDEIFDVDIHLIPERKGEPAHFHYDIRYVMRADAGEEYVVSEESHNLGWIPIESLHQFTTEASMLRMAGKWRCFNTKSSSTIRLARERDEERLSELFDAYRQFYDQPPDRALARRFIGQRMENNDAIILVAENEQGIVVGFCQLYPSFCSILALPIYILYDVYVDPSARRAGVASALLSHIVELARRNGVARIDLSTARLNTAAQQLYESLGWVRDDVFLVYNRKV